MPPNSTDKDLLIKLPDGITNDYFQDILDKRYGAGVKIKDLRPLNAFGGGENYASQLFRIEIDAMMKDNTEETISYIFKTNPLNPFGADMVKKMDLFEKETEMYEIIIPAFEKLYADNGKVVKFGPNCLKTTKDPDTIVLEDLKNQNFANEKRQTGLDMEHILSVLKKLGEFHAASVCYKDINGAYTRMYTEGMYKEELKEIFEAMNKANNQLYLECMEEWDFGPKYLDKIKNIQNTMIDRFIDIGRYNENDFNVLNHGDLWCNNIMFNHNNDGSINKTYFIDYQMCKFGSPSQDLYYFLLSSSRPDLKIKDFDYFVKIYHNNLVENLNFLKYKRKIPTLAEIQIGLLKNCGWGIMTCVGVMTAVLLDPIKTAKLENFIDSDPESIDFKKAAFRNPRYINTMREILPWLENRGSLE